MTGPQKAKFRKESAELLQVLAALSEKQLCTIVKHLNGTAIDYIGTLVHNLTQYKNSLKKEDKKKLLKCLSENRKLANYLSKPTNSYRVKRKKLQEQDGGALLTALLSVGHPVLAEIIAIKFLKKCLMILQKFGCYMKTIIATIEVIHVLNVDINAIRIESK